MHTVIRGFFEIINQHGAHKNNSLTYYALVNLDGILEDSRTRVKYFVEVMNDFKAKIDLVDILIRFITSVSKELPHRDIASHILVLLIDAEKNEKVADHSNHFLNAIMT